MERVEPGFANAWVSEHGLVDVRRPPAADADSVAARLAIIETIQCYAWSVDERRMDVFADLFTRDAEFEIVIAGGGWVETPSGRDAITLWMSDYMDSVAFQMRHRMGNVLVVEQSESRAIALSYLQLTATTPEQAEVMATAVYTWTMSLDDGTWRFAKVSAAFDRTFS